jgi:3-deoxy-D-manno-octulosonic-acid transferase
MDEAASEGLAIGAEGAWRWDDTVGVLNDYYAAAEVAFVGGSLARFGGHNPIEPAACGAAVLIGPYHASQAQGVRALRARDAIDVVGAERELPLALREALEDVARCEARGRIAREVAEAMRGAARRAAAELAIRGLWAGRP